MLPKCAMVWSISALIDASSALSKPIAMAWLPNSATRAWAASTLMSAATTRARSEEHTSELQSLMRISYAVFCLKKKKIQIPNTIRTLETPKDLGRTKTTQRSKQEHATKTQT